MPRFRYGAADADADGTCPGREFGELTAQAVQFDGDIVGFVARSAARDAARPAARAAARSAARDAARPAARNAVRPTRMPFSGNISRVFYHWMHIPHHFIP
ncbi:hypothetical protein DVH02_31130 [Streptomyces corynorhini]|uniref:Uncharacterized protein n=1 Tax=Streptomyces corynorhini TaxID=2282652 RepID=A0A370AWK9_9ACTN|nr:hypothetical protein DVH02_31130 [Streptomyces corynorhini]